MGTRILGHLFIDDKGAITATPTVRATAEDIARLKAMFRDRFVSVDERLSAGRAKAQ